jgi:CBS-domain-containing membrane protein
LLTRFSGDRLLMDALQLMSDEGLTSVAVVDNAFNVVGNISTADIKLLTTTSSLPLLKSSCIHFISVILSERGIGDGKDSFPGEFERSSSLRQL